MSLVPFIDPGKLNKGHVQVGIPSEMHPIADLVEETAYSNIPRRAARKDEPPLTHDTFGTTHAVRRVGTSKLVIVYNHRNTRRAHDELGATHVPVVVHDVRTLAEEAEQMEKLYNTQPVMSEVQRHTLRVSWGEPLALRLEELLNSVGLTGTNNDPTRLRVTSIAAMRSAWGEEGKFSSNAVLTKKELDRGAVVFAWVIKSLIGRVNAGDAPNSVFRKATIRTLAWIGRRAKKKPSWRTMQRILAPLTLDEIAYGVLAREYKNSRSSVWAHNLREMLDALAGTPLIDIPELNKP